ncbi:MAG TPA: DegQ family serine endoprotease [Vicinamibacterales bacterium]|nr:DegQ family serine endoprotease [Vicinamibacterales bacterium]
MNLFSVNLGQRLARTSAAIGAAILLIGGAAVWTISADAQAKSEPAAVRAQQVPSPAIARANIGARDSYADIVKSVSPAVVTIRTEGRAVNSLAQFSSPNDDFFRRFFGDPDDPRSPRQPREFRQRGLGSGVIVSNDGYILTNNHVVDGADEVRVEMTDGRSVVAMVVGTDEPSDLALVKISAGNLRTVPLGNSDAVEVGDVVLAVGNPLGVGQTVTMGIISAKGRATGAGSGSYEEFLQTDAPINQGNSGGALVNLKGELVGINSQIVSATGGNIGIGFAIPSNMAKHVMDELRTDGKVTRAQLGVSVQAVTSDLAEGLGLKDVGGALIGSVTPGSAADRAGLERGDVIRSFNGQPVTDTNSLRNRVAESKPGSTAQVGIVRDGKERTIGVTLDELTGGRVARNSGPAGAADQAALGVSVAPLTPELASRYQLPRDTRGVVVQDVDPDGRAAGAGIRTGDVIEEVNRRPIQTVDDLRAAVREASDRPVLLLVNRQGSSMFVTVRPNGGQ